MQSRTNGASNRTIAEGMNSRGGRPRDGASRLKRRDMIRLGVASIGAGMVSGLDVVAAGATGQEKIVHAHKPLRAAFSNIGLQVSWCVQGKQAAEFWGDLFNVEVTWFDGGLSVVQQRAALEEIASRKWDFVAIQAVAIDTLADPVNRIIDEGIPVIDMDTLIAPLDSIDVHTFLAPDNEFMGAAVTKALVDAIGGTGTFIMTQGALGHTGAQGRARGFASVIAQNPNIEVLETDSADWDPARVVQLWELYLDTYPHISAAFFHNDDMALAALDVMRRRNRTETLVGGVDAMPPAIQAVLDGRMYATVRNPSCRIHGGAIVAGVDAARAPKKAVASPPKHIVVDGPIVTQANGPGLLWMEEHFLI